MVEFKDFDPVFIPKLRCCGLERLRALFDTLKLLGVLYKDAEMSGDRTESVHAAASPSIISINNLFIYVDLAVVERVVMAEP